LPHFLVFFENEARSRLNTVLGGGTVFPVGLRGRSLSGSVNGFTNGVGSLT
jgi:hypothetical protein